MTKTALALALTLSATPVLAWDRPVEIENYLYYPTAITKIEFVPIAGLQRHTWDDELWIPGWRAPNGKVYSQTVRMPNDPPCLRKLKFSFKGHVPVTWPIAFDVCGTKSIIDIRHATPTGGPNSALKITFE